MKPLEISTYANSTDSKMFIDIINQGIDARLTAFTKSRFNWDSNRLNLEFHPNEIEILLRRLSELDKPEYPLSQTELWEFDIINAWYHYEIYI